MEKEVQLYIGKVCNNLCKFCIDDEPPEERKFVSPSVLKKSLRKFSKENYNVVGFFGGEVTIYPKIEEMIKYATALGYKRINLVSNGRKYADMNFLRKLVRSGNIRFYFSVHSENEKTEDFLTSIKGGFKEKIKGLSNLAQLNKHDMIKENIFLNIVVNRLNYRSLPEMMYFYYRNFRIKDFRFRYIIPLGRAFTNSRLLTLRYTRAFPYLKKVILLSNKLNINVSLDGIPFCILNKIKNFQDFVGEFKDGLGNSKHEIDLQAKSKNFNKNTKDPHVKTKNCRKCIYYSLCEGPWENYVKLYGSKEFKPVIRS